MAASSSRLVRNIVDTFVVNCSTQFVRNSVTNTLVGTLISTTLVIEVSTQFVRRSTSSEEKAEGTRRAENNRHNPRIAFAKPASILQTTVSGNAAAANGGGIVLSNYNLYLVVDNSTVTANTALSGNGGGFARTSAYGGCTCVTSTPFLDADMRAFWKFWSNATPLGTGTASPDATRLEGSKR